MEKLRILFLTYQGDTAGSTQSIAFLTKGLAKRGHQVFLGMREESLLWSLVADSKVERIAMRFNGRFDLKNWKHIKEVVEKNQIQLINAQSSYDRYTSAFAKLRYGLNCKVIHTRRQMPLSLGGPLQLIIFNHQVDGIVAVSQQVGEALVKLGIKQKNVKIIHNGTPKEKYERLNEKRIEELKKKFEITEDDVVIGCVSRMKNQMQLIQALKLVNKPVKVIFCGIEPTEEMKSTISQFGLAHQVYFEGAVSGEDILNYYPLFTIKVLASTMEGLSQSLLEAMALGVPVIATAFAGNLDLIENETNGLLFEDGNVGHLARNINSLIDNEPLKKQLIEKGKETALVKFNIENTISNYEQYFSKLVVEKHA